MNHIAVTGRLVKDNELREIGREGSVKTVNNTLAIRRDGKITDFIDVRFFGKQAEIVSQYCKKGSLLLCQGSVRVDTFKDKEDKTRKSIYILAANIELLSDRVDNEEHKQMKQEAAAEQENKPFDIADIDEDDLPY